MTYLQQTYGTAGSAELTEHDLLETLSTFAYRLPYCVIAAPGIQGRKNCSPFVCPPLDVISDAVNSMNSMDADKISCAEKRLLRYLPGFSAEDCWQTVLKFVFLLEFAKAAKTDVPLFKKEFALPKGHYKSIQDYVLKNETADEPVRYPGLIEDIGEETAVLSDASIQDIWTAASSSPYRIQIRPIVEKFFQVLQNKAANKTWDHQIFELIFSEAITDAEGSPIRLPKNTSNWTECLRRVASDLKLNPSLFYKKITSKFSSSSLSEDDDFKSKNTPLGCKRGDRLCQDPVLRFLNDILTIFRWVRNNYGFCLRDCAVYTLYLLPHLAFWKLNFNCTNLKQNMSFPFFKCSDLDPSFFLKSTKLCSFLMHAARKLGTRNYLHWAFSGFAGNYLDDSELQKQSLLKAQGHLNESKECAYSSYQGLCGKQLTASILNTPYRCL